MSQKDQELEKKNVEDKRKTTKIVKAPFLSDGTKLPKVGSLCNFEKWMEQFTAAAVSVQLGKKIFLSQRLRGRQLEELLVSQLKYAPGDAAAAVSEERVVLSQTEIKQRTIVARLKLDCPLREAKKDGAENYWRILLSIAPTVLLDSERRPAPAGIWRIDISAKIPKEAYLSSWIQRDVAVSGASFQARQSYFEDSVYENNRFDNLTDIAVTDRGNTHIKRNGTTSGIATLSTSAKSKIGITVVGGYKWSNNAGCVSRRTTSQRPVPDVYPRHSHPNKLDPDVWQLGRALQCGRRTQSLPWRAESIRRRSGPRMPTRLHLSRSGSDQGATG